jgi:catechol 2,3-dioxygenase-like lactoylglutathione lyase family enzyme
MQVKRIVANFQTPDPSRARAFYQDVLGLDLLMDHDRIHLWLKHRNVRPGEPRHGRRIGHHGAGLSIEVDDVKAAFERIVAAGLRPSTDRRRLTPLKR